MCWGSRSTTGRPACELRLKAWISSTKALRNSVKLNNYDWPQDRETFDQRPASVVIVKLRSS